MFSYLQGSLRPLTSHEASFLLQDSVIKLFLRGHFDRINWINDIILRVTGHATRSVIDPVPDASLYYNLTHLTHLANLGSALFATLGFDPDAPDSFRAVIETASSFFILGQSLSLDHQDVYCSQLQTFITAALKEISSQWRSYLESSDPIGVFTSALLPIESPAKLVLLEARSHYDRLFELKSFLPGMFVSQLGVAGGNLISSQTPGQSSEPPRKRSERAKGGGPSQRSSERVSSRLAAAKPALASEVKVGSRADSCIFEVTAKEFKMGNVVHKIADVEAIIGKKCMAVALSNTSWPYSLSMCNQSPKADHKSATSEAHKFSSLMKSKIATYLAPFEAWS
jgi:hypothetical protein